MKNSTLRFDVLGNTYKDFYIFDKFMGYADDGVGITYHDALDDIAMGW